jgi:sigma-E factor negative regulatory protein RseC
MSYLCKVHTKISHSGIIESIAEGCVKVRILQTSACAACKIAGHCNASESKEKIVEVFTDHTGGYSLGQEVVVCASRDVANKALLLGFGVPFLVLVGVLVLVLRVTGNEGVAALSGLLALVPYYFVLYLFRSRIREQLSFYIE